MAERSILGLAVLLVEDDVDSQEVMTEFLIGLGCEVRVAGSAAEARAHLASWLPDVILCDVTLPDEDGFAMVSGLRGDPRTAAVPAIAMTGRSDGAARGRATRAGFQKFVTKPFDLFALPAALTSASSMENGAPVLATFRQYELRSSFSAGNVSVCGCSRS